MGKALPEDNQRDTGAFVLQSPKIHSSNQAAKNRRRQRERARSLLTENPMQKRARTDLKDAPKDLPGILHKALDDAGKQQALMFIAGYKDFPPSVKAEALPKIQKMAGLLPETDDDNSVTYDCNDDIEHEGRAANFEE